MNYIFVHMLDNKSVLIIMEARYKHEDYCNYYCNQHNGLPNIKI